MSDGLNFEVNITDNTAKVGEELETALEKALTEIGISAEKIVKKVITQDGLVDTGLLRNSITWAIGGDKANISEYEANKSKEGEKKKGYYTENSPKRDEPCVYIGTNVEYAPHLELGSRGKVGQPFLEQGVIIGAKKYSAILKNNLENGGNE